jgi:catechol 2,3-dioxygenase-like lactoylglutathione lyase family enzyme
MLIRCLDHMIVCVRNRQDWVPIVNTVLGLQPRQFTEGDEWGFSNVIYDIGDGYLGIVEPSGEQSSLHRFLERFDEGFYAISIDVGDLDTAARAFKEHGAPYREARRGEQLALLWLQPSATHGVLYQVTRGGSARQGANPLYLGLAEVVIAVNNAEQAAATYRRLFGFGAPRPVADAHLGYQGLALEIRQRPFSQSLVLAEPTGPGTPLAEQLARRGQGIFQFTIAVSDLAKELARLDSLGVPRVVEGTVAHPRRALIAPETLRGLRVELRERG